MKVGHYIYWINGKRICHGVPLTVVNICPALVLSGSCYRNIGSRRFQIQFCQLGLAIAQLCGRNGNQVMWWTICALKSLHLRFYSCCAFFCQYVCTLGIEPTTFCIANTMLYHWETDHKNGLKSSHLTLTGSQHSIPNIYWLNKFTKTIKSNLQILKNFFFQILSTSLKDLGQHPKVTLKLDKNFRLSHPLWKDRHAF